MATRFTKIQLAAEIGDFLKKMRQASDAAKGVGEGADQGADQAQRGLGRLAGGIRKHGDDMREVGGVLTGIGAAAALGVGAAVKAYADYDRAMSAVQAATHETEGNMELLGAAAIKAGADTQFSATGAANAIEELGKAGVSTEDILGGGLSGALNLAAAGNLEVGQAAEIAASAMTQFNLTGGDVPHIADLLAAGAGKAQGSVEDLGMALNQSGIVASQTGLSIEEATGGLAAFASAGLIGSDAGTSFKTMLQALTPQSKEAQKAMESMGFSAYDADGNFVGLTEVAGRLQQGLKGMSEEQQNATLKTIFGSDAIRAAAVLAEQGASGIATWTDKVNDAGYAAETAAALMDNLSGDLEGLRGSLETALIGTGEGADGALRGLVQTLDGVVDGYNGLDDGAKRAVLTTGGLVAAAGLAGGAFLTLAPKVVDVYDAYQNIVRANPRMETGLKQTAKAAGLAAAAFAALTIIDSVIPDAVDSIKGLRESTEIFNDLSDAGPPAAEALDEFFQVGNQSSNSAAGLKDFNEAARRLNANGLYEFADKTLGATIGALGLYESEIVLAEEATKRYDETIAGMVTNGNAEGAANMAAALSRELQATGLSAEEAQAFMPEYNEALAVLEEQQAATAESAAATAYGIEGLADAANRASDFGAPLVTSLSEWAAAFGATDEQMEAMQDRISDLAESMSGFVSPVNAYTDLLDRKKAAEQESAQATADSTEDSSDSWEDYANDVSISLTEYNDSLREQIEAQATWRDNMRYLVGKVSDETLQTLAAMGPEGAGLVAELRDSSVAELATFDDLMGQASEAGSDAFAEEIIFATDPIAQIAADFGQAAADEANAHYRSGEGDMAATARRYGYNIESQTSLIERIGADFGGAARDEAIGAIRSGERTAGQIARNYGYNIRNENPLLASVGRRLGEGARDGLLDRFRSGTGTMLDAALSYGVNIATGLNPILRSLSKPQIDARRARGVLEADGGVLDFYAAGGVAEDHTAQIAPAGSWRVWAEPETGGEAYIPLSPSKRKRSLDIWQETGQRLGVRSIIDGAELAEAESFAQGGFSSAEDVPRAPRIPGSGGIPRPAQGGVDKVRAETIAWLEANMLGTEGFVSPPGAGTSVAALLAYGRALRAQGLRVSSNAALGSPPSRGAHSPTGFHYKFGNSGAIDVNSHPGESAAEKRRLTPVALDALRKGFGVQWLSSGHYNHLHVDVGKYRAVGNTAAWMANGGMLGASEDHQAQTVTGLRTFGEPETGGEAYIPLAAHKRGRSLMVLQGVASQFGYTLSKMGDQTFAAPQYAAALTSSLSGDGGARVTVHQTITAPEPVAAGRVSAARMTDTLNILGL